MVGRKESEMKGRISREEKKSSESSRTSNRDPGKDSELTDSGSSL